MNQYKDTSQATNTLKTPKNGQIDTSAKVTFSDVIKSILLAVLIIALLLFITTLQQAHPKNSLPLGVGVIDNSATTKYSAAKPSRHSLAIFVPKIYGATNPIIATGAKRHIYSLLPIQNGSNASYGGLIRPNTIAFMVNKSSRLVTVVETRPPFLSVGIQTTNLLGGYHA